MVDDLRAGLVSTHEAPTGSGKSYELARAAATLYREGRKVGIAVPTIRLAEETRDRLRELIPGAFRDGVVAEIFGRDRPGLLERRNDLDDAGVR